MMRRLTVIICICLSTLNAAKAAPGDALAPRPAAVKPDQTSLKTFHRRDAVSVKFRDDLPIRADNGKLADRSGGALDARAQTVINSLNAGRWNPSFRQSEDTLAQMRDKARQSLGKQVADLRTQFTFTLPEGADPVKTIDVLNALDIVEIALPMPSPAPLPTVGNYQPNQGYLNAPPVGINAIGMWTSPYNTMGLIVRIADIEYSWNFNHQDLPTPTLLGPAPVDPFNDNNHGTAVLGEMVSLDNGWGTRGICGFPAVNVVAANTAAGYDVGAAVLTAAAAMHPGDVILIEQQTQGPNYTGNPPGTQVGMVPVEWYQPWYNAIVTAVGNGLVVVEAAGNGYQNLDDPIYSTGNWGHHPFQFGNDSGAIMVGGGGAPGSPNGNLSRLSYSNYGSTVDLQGWGEGVMTTGYGNAYSAEGPNLYYTNTFNGTSSASPIVAGACCLLQDYYRLSTSHVLSPAQVKDLLRLSGAPQQDGVNPAFQNIGPRPNVTAAAALLDFTPPYPNPLWFMAPPAPISENMISMMASLATDTQNGPVEYLFQHDPTDNGHDSFWNSSSSFMDFNLTANTRYGYSVKARDHSQPTPNETASSGYFYTATWIESPSGLYFGQVTDTSIEVHAMSMFGGFSNLAVDQSGLYFEMSPPAGIGANVWVQNDIFVVTGLAPNTTYNFRVKARNQFGVETLYSAMAGTTTSGSSVPVHGDCNGNGIFEIDWDTQCFVDVLLGYNFDPGSISRCDMNHDLIIDGRDIQTWVQCALGWCP